MQLFGLVNSLLATAGRTGPAGAVAGSAAARPNSSGGAFGGSEDHNGDNNTGIRPVIASIASPTAAETSVGGTPSSSSAETTVGEADAAEEDELMSGGSGKGPGAVEARSGFASSYPSIQRYAVLPLSHNAGVVGWVPHTDTLYSLIKDYRERREIPLDVELRLLRSASADYDKLPVIGKVWTCIWC